MPPGDALAGAIGVVPIARRSRLPLPPSIAIYELCADTSPIAITLTAGGNGNRGAMVPSA